MMRAKDCRGILAHTWPPFYNEDYDNFALHFIVCARDEFAVDRAIEITVESSQIIVSRRT